VQEDTTENLVYAEYVSENSPQEGKYLELRRQSGRGLENVNDGYCGRYDYQNKEWEFD